MEKKNEKAVTIDDIARMAGVGKGTVDRVIHNRGRVSQETADRVNKVIQDLNYKPNAAARILGKRKELRIAVIYHNYESEFWQQVEDGIKRAELQYASMGVRIDRFVLERLDPVKQEEVLEKVSGLGYDGVALVPYTSEKVARLINNLVDRGIPVITFNNDEPCRRTAYVGQNLYRSGRTAGELMAMMARQDAVFVELIAICEGMSAFGDRLKGFQEVIDNKRADMVRYGTFTFKEDSAFAYNLTKSLLISQNIDAIYVSNVMVETVGEVIRDLEMKHPPLLIGHDITPGIIQYLQEGIINVTIGQEPEKQGYLAIEKICHKLLMDEDISDDIFTKIEIIVSENIP